MQITEKDFKSYVNVQKSGITNMFDTRVVQQCTNLSKDKIIDIMRNYASLYKKYYEND